MLKILLSHLGRKKKKKEIPGGGWGGRRAWREVTHLRYSFIIIINKQGYRNQYKITYTNSFLHGILQIQDRTAFIL